MKKTIPASYIWPYATLTSIWQLYVHDKTDTGIPIIRIHIISNYSHYRGREMCGIFCFFVINENMVLNKQPSCGDLIRHGVHSCDRNDPSYKMLACTWALIQYKNVIRIGNPIVEIRRPSYLHNGISKTGKTASLSWIGALVSSATKSRWVFLMRGSCSTSWCCNR